MTLTIDLAQYQISRDYFNRLASEFCGKILETTNDGSEVDVEFKESDEHAKGFKRALDASFLKR